jgi:DNA-binding NarL/FixJ family response regulator
MRVLVFDDDLAKTPSVLDGIEDVEVILVGHPERAVELVVVHDPDVVCMDFAFRGRARSGAAAIAELRRTWDHRELYIVGISRDSPSNARLRAPGANDVVRKDLLRTALAELASRFA